MTDTRPTCPQCGTPLVHENAIPTCPNCDCDRAGNEAERSIHDEPDPMFDCPRCGRRLVFEGGIGICPDMNCDQGDPDGTADWLDDEDEMEREIIDDILHDEAAERLDAEDEAAIDAALDDDPEADVMRDLSLE